MMNPSQITLLLADDHPLFRKGLHDTIRQSTKYTIIGEASDGQEAYRLIAEMKPTIAILDVEMPKLNGLDVAQKVNENNLPVSVIILTMYEEYALFNKAIDAGVKGYILKESAVNDILIGISKVAEGEYFFSPSLSGFLVKRNTAANRINDATSELEHLTPMEKQILDLIAKSFSSREIANRLSVTIRTIETHRYNIAQKLGLKGSYALLRYALANKEKASHPTHEI